MIEPLVSRPRFAWFARAPFIASSWAAASLGAFLFLLA
jgi:hypothetical protein